MSYQVLARKWRPRNFSQVVGQEHVVKALTNALQHDRMHHAYLFTGTRGVGKTTLARILAKVINCESRRGFEPCGQCSICSEVDEGRFIDLIEVDAASRTKVEDTRDLLENVQYAPNQGHYKVYLIDEVHMLSGHSFNALLKTLEEPPAHVKFLLATTDPQKIPITVLSRCLQLNLKRLSVDQIAGQMEFILKDEKIEYDQRSLNAIGRAADGSMRDGLSLLDQAIVYGSGRVTEKDVDAMLGSVATQPVSQLLEGLIDGNAKNIMETISGFYAQAADFAEVLQQFLLLLHRIALTQMMSEFIADDDDAEMILAFAGKLSPEDVQFYYQAGLVGQRDLPLAPDPRSGFEMVLLRMLAFRPVEIQATSAFPEKGVDPGEKPESLLTPLSAVTGEVEAAIDNSIPKEKNSKNEQWFDVIQAINIKGLVKELASNTVLENIDEKNCLLRLAPEHAQLRSSRVELALQAAIQEYYKKPLKLIIKVEAFEQETLATLQKKQRDDRQKAAELSIDQDQNIKALKETFDAQVLPGTIEPID
ncbi:MAG: DNA polymerase III subunit gamma/tau [Methylococcales bacterium]